VPYSHDGKLRRKRKRKRSDGLGDISLYKYDSIALPSFHEPETFVEIVIIIRQIIWRGYRTVPVDITSAPCYRKISIRKKLMGLTFYITDFFFNRKLMLTWNKWFPHTVHLWKQQYRIIIDLQLDFEINKTYTCVGHANAVAFVVIRRKFHI
jgi:hypothetical protein